MRVGCIIPDRGDRNDFIDHCHIMLHDQSFKDFKTWRFDYKPTSNDPDLTQRIRRMYKQASKYCDIVFIIENDDWYSRIFLSTMLAAYIHAGQPDIFGIGQTYYYHLRINKWLKWIHSYRSSLFCTILKCGLDIEWPVDNFIQLDIKLWKQLKGKTFTPDNIITLGIKHGEGMCGGRGHKDLEIYDNNDPDREFLKTIIDEKSLEFYSTKN